MKRPPPLLHARSWRRWLPVCVLLACRPGPLPAGEIAASDRPGVAADNLLAASLRFCDKYWDEAAGLLWSPAEGEHGVHRLRESTWYALGLLQRAGPGDPARAQRIIGRILESQFDAPGQRWDGTFRRTPEEPQPQPGAQLWKDYDPNWRQFIGTAFVLILKNHERRLSPDLVGRMRTAIRRAVESELTQGRDEPYHTNIMLLHGFLLGWAGQQFDRPDWIAQSESWLAGIRAKYAAHGTFEEYNSPTYYGVDFYALALCRRYGATAKIRAVGAELEAGLWREVAKFYHAGLKNMCGPFDRAYGMDMRRYVTLTGEWLALALPPELTPLPDPAGPMQHAHDFVFAPCFVALGAQIPEEAMPAFCAFSGERTLERVITPERTATAWLSRDVMLGGELTGRTRGAGPPGPYTQFIPATAHWRVGASGVGWLALSQCPPVDARADARRIRIATLRGDSVFRLAAPGIDPTKITATNWTLPALQVTVKTDATSCTVAVEKDFLEVTYHAATRIELQTSHQP